MRTVVSKETEGIQNIFRSAAIPRDAVVVVHSSFRNLSGAGFRAEHFIDALLDALGGAGTLLMPAMSWRSVTVSNPFFDELTTASHVGILPEIFRVSYASARSLHPTHSVAGCGPAVETLLARHYVDDTPVSANSPYGLMRDYDAYILTVGVGLDRVTAIHHAEEVIAPGLYLHPVERAETYQCRDRQRNTRAVRLRRHYRLNRDFTQFESPLAATGRLLTGNIAGTRWMAVALRDLLREVFATLIKREDAIIVPETVTSGDVNV